MIPPELVASSVIVGSRRALAESQTRDGWSHSQSGIGPSDRRSQETTMRLKGGGDDVPLDPSSPCFQSCESASDSKAGAHRYLAFEKRTGLGSQGIREAVKPRWVTSERPARGPGRAVEPSHRVHPVVARQQSGRESGRRLHVSTPHTKDNMICQVDVSLREKMEKSLWCENESRHKRQDKHHKIK